MTTAATLLTETIVPAAKTAAGDVVASGGVPGGLSGQAQFMTTFAALLAEGNFVQAPGMVPLEGEGAPSLAALLSMDEVGSAASGEDVQADPLFNVIPLFDSTSLSPLTPKAPLTGLGLSMATPISDGASIKSSTAAPMGGDAHVPTQAPTQVPAQIPVATANGVLQAIPVQSDPVLYNGDQAAPAPAPAQAQARPTSQEPVLKGITAADVAAEIAQLNIGAVATAPVTTDGNRNVTVTAVPAATAQSLAIDSPVALVAATSLAAASIVATSLAATGIAATEIADGRAAREGEAPDPRVTSQIAQVTQQSPQARATITKAAAKPTTGLSSALSGDVALAAMAIESPKPIINRPAARLTPTAGQGVSGTATPVAGQGADASATQSTFPASFPALTQRPAQPLTGQGNMPGAGPGQTLEQNTPGGEAGRLIADIADQPAAPRVSFDARVESLQVAPQPLRAGEAVGQAERLTAMPAPPNAQPNTPPAEQVALQLRNAVAKGADKITIHLNPASLGAVDVTLEVSSGARVVVHVVADRVETLDLLRADARALDRALQDAGLRTEQGSLNFNLRGDGNNNASQQNATAFNEFDEGGTNGDAETDGDGDLDADDTSSDQPARPASNQALDIEV